MVYLDPDFVISLMSFALLVFMPFASAVNDSSSKPTDTVQLALVCEVIFTLVVVAIPHPVREKPNMNIHKVSNRCFKCLFIVIVTSLF